MVAPSAEKKEHHLADVMVVTKVDPKADPKVDPKVAVMVAS